MHASAVTAATRPRSPGARIAYGALTAVLLAAVVFEAVGHGTGYWQLAAFVLGPDLALLYGAGKNLEQGQLHPRATALYNLLHRFWLPLGLAALASFGFLSLGYFVGALAWALHIGLDRTVGYGLRTRDGFQRP